MGMFRQAKRLVPGLGDGTPASANAYLALIGTIGLVGWGATALLRHFVSAQRVYLFGSDVFVFGWAGAVAVGWVALYAVRMLVGLTRVDRGVTFSMPEIAWTGVVVLAFGATFWGLTLDPTQFLLKIQLTWMPWLGAFAVGYLLTGLLVDRGGVYLLAGVVAAGALGVSLLGTPVPYPLVVLGALHTIPLFVDAYRGGRQLTDDGVPALRGGAEADEAGGVVTA